MATPTASARPSRRPHVKTRRAQRAQTQERERVTEQILAAGSSVAAAAQAVARIVKAQLTDYFQTNAQRMEYRAILRAGKAVEKRQPHSGPATQSQ